MLTESCVIYFFVTERCVVFLEEERGGGRMCVNCNGDIHKAVRSVGDKVYFPKLNLSLKLLKNTTMSL